MINRPTNYVKFLLIILFSNFYTILSAQDMVKEGAQDGLMKTVSYDVSSFTDLRDKKLQDVMMKMPGLNGMDYSGSVFFTYNGMDVSKIYVNGMDVLEGNNQPVYNLKPEDVERVEITENHVSIHIMKGKQYSNAASINVILKDSASGKWSGALKAMGGGTPVLGAVDFNGLNLGPKVQTTVMFKADNTGLDYSGPLHGFGDYGMSASDMYNEDAYEGLTGVSGSFDYMLRKFLDVEPNLAPLSSERVRFNRSGIAQVSSTFKLSSDYQLNVQLTLHGNRLTANSTDETTFFNGSHSTKLTKFEDAKSHQYDWQSTATLLSNTDTQFLRNQLSFHHRRIDMKKDLGGSEMDFYNMNTNPIYLKNDFHIKRLLGEHVLSVNVMAGYNTRPQDLNMDGVKTINQEISSKSGYVDLGTKLDLILAKGLNLSLNAGGAYNSRSMISLLEGYSYGQDACDDLQILNVFGGASMTYITDKLQAELKLPLVYGRYKQDFESVHGVREAYHSKDTIFTISPKLSLKYDFTPRFSVAGELGLNQQAPDRKRLFFGNFFQDTQTMQSGYHNQIYRNDTWEMILSSTYRNPEHAFFANGSVNYSRSKNPYLISRSFHDLFVLTQYVAAPDIPSGNSLSLSADVNKGIAFLRGKIGLAVQVMTDKSYLLRQASPMEFMHTNSSSYTISPYVNGKLLNWCNMVYKLDYSTFSMQMSDFDKHDTHSITQTMELIFSPWDKLNFSLLGEHYYTEFSDNQSKNLVLADFKAEYNLNEKWQLLLTATNILNHDTYNYTLVDSANFTHSFTSYNIRPRNILLGVFYKF